MQPYATRYVLSKDGFIKAMNECGYASVSELAAALGVHRNSLSNYINGGSVFSAVLERAFAKLQADPTKLIQAKLPKFEEPELEIAGLVDAIAASAADCCVVLFGSRARGTHKRFSDFDLGVFKLEGVPFSTFSEMLSLVDEWNESTMLSAQLTNISNADDPFLRQIGPDLRFLGGSNKAWLRLLGRVKGAIHGG